MRIVIWKIGQKSYNKARHVKKLMGESGFHTHKNGVGQGEESNSRIKKTCVKYSRKMEKNEIGVKDIAFGNKDAITGL